jgi:methionine synthase II (cobalamin-independent)
MLVKEFSSIRTTDVGSFPLINIDSKRYAQGAANTEDGRNSNDAKYFIQSHNTAFKQKLTALGTTLSTSSYVQSSHTRDMVSQFLDPIVRHGSGLQKHKDNYLWDGSTIQLPPNKAHIAELIALKQHAKDISHELELDSIRYRVCVTGPFELLTRIWRSMGVSPRYNESLIEAFSTIVQHFMQNANFETKYLKPEIFTLEEPSIGVTGVGDLFMDTERDENLSHLITHWNTIFSATPQHHYRGLHLHASPYHQLARANWNLLEAHLHVVTTRDWLIEHDKYIRAAIMRTDGPTIPPNADLKTIWTEIQTGQYQPYLQPKTDTQQLLHTAIQRYGKDRTPFAGPECGLGSWDWKHGDTMVLENLTRLRDVVSEFNAAVK